MTSLFSMCAGKLHALELAGQQHNNPAVCVGFSLFDDLDDDGASTGPACPSYMTSFCARFSTDTSDAADASGEESIKQTNVYSTNVKYTDNYALSITEEIVDNGDTSVTVSVANVRILALSFQLQVKLSTVDVLN